MEKVLITGISGEVGHVLAMRLSKKGIKVIATDIQTIPEEIKPFVEEFYQGDIGDYNFVEKISKDTKFDTVFHLAGLLSTGSEKSPRLSANVNVGGTLNLLEAITQKSLNEKLSIKFIFPSSIAAYGIPDLDTKKKAGKIKENEYLNPYIFYGISKLACEKFGKYFSKNYKLLDRDLDRNNLIDFRSVRFPGLMSPFTIPTGGTSDYGSEMIHSAAQNKNYDCFVRPETKISFLAMDDGVDILINLASAPKDNLKNLVYNVSGFSVSAEEIYKMVKKFFPDFKMDYKINEERQKIVDSWPEDTDDTNARNDWGYKLNYDFEKTFSEYLIPKIRQRYQSK